MTDTKQKCSRLERINMTKKQVTVSDLTGEEIIEGGSTTIVVCGIQQSDGEEIPFYINPRREMHIERSEAGELFGTKPSKIYVVVSHENIIAYTSKSLDTVYRIDDEQADSIKDMISNSKAL